MVGNPRRNALFGAVPETRGLQGLDGGGRSLIRTRLLGPANSRYQGKIQGEHRISITIVTTMAMKTNIHGLFFNNSLSKLTGKQLRQNRETTRK